MTDLDLDLTRDDLDDELATATDPAADRAPGRSTNRARSTNRPATSDAAPRSTSGRRSINERDPFDDVDLIDHCAVYLRISLDRDGDERAVERQREDAKAVARMRGWDIVETYVDNSISASKAEIIRPEYERMLADYRRGRFGAIIAYDLDRLTRQPRQLEDWIDEAERRGLVIVTLNGEADLSTDGGRMFARIKAAVARAEIERKSARHKRANLQRAEQGHWQFSRRPFGYERRDGRVEIIEHEAEIVREGYRRYLAGESYYEIANDWNDRGIATHDTNAAEGERTRWSMTRVRSLLRNGRYAGIVEHNGKVFEDAKPTWQPLIDMRTWDDYVSTREGRTRAGSWSTSTKHLLSGLALCGVCGGRMLARPEYRRNPDGGRRTRMSYQCTTGWCVSIGSEDVDTFVERLVLARLGDKKILAALRHVPDTAPIQAELAALRRRRDDIADLLADGLLDRRKARAQAVELTQKIETRQARLTAMRRASPLTDLALARSIPTRWKGLGVLDKRRVIEDLGLTVTIKKTHPGRRPNGPDGKPLPDLHRIAVEWLDA
jgi:DNA invertase Pin-like site-specific DNA recombinase